MNTENPYSHTSINRLLDDARRRLVETGTRNRLIHVNRTATRGNSLNIVNERTSDIFDILRVNGKRMRFAATGQDDEHDDDAPVLAVSEDHIDPARYRDQILETAIGPEQLQRRLLRLLTDARTSEEEQGFNILYLAMGFLTWFESPSSRVPREAPLILMPVQLARDERRASFNLAARDDDIVTNLPLQERLRNDFGIEPPEIEDGEDWRPSDYLARIDDLVAGQNGWEVDHDGMQLGFFSFAKLLMLRDLDPDNWQDNALEENSLIRGLLDEGFSPETPLFGDNSRLDERLDPADVVHVVDADASQAKVIEEIRAGRNFVVQGPPGTGKSQTIANIIAGAVHDGKTVLFMAEKMAALSVVHDRLEKVGLGDLCLELHSRTANKKAFLQEVASTLAAGQNPQELPDDPEELRRARDRLNAIASLLHEPVPGYSFTPFSTIAEIGRFVGRDVPPPGLKADGLEALDDAGRDTILGRVGGYADRLMQSGPRHEHPLYGVTATDLQPTDRQRLKQNLADAAAALRDLRKALEQICGSGGLRLPDRLAAADVLAACLLCAARRPAGAEEAAESLFAFAGQTRMSEALAIGRDWRSAQDDATDSFLEAAWDAPVVGLRARIAAGVGSVWARWFGGYRGASAQLAGLTSAALPKAPGDRLALLDRLIEVQNKRKSLADEEAWLREALGPAWRGERTEFALLETVADWLGELSDSGWLTDADGLCGLLALAPDGETLAGALDRCIGAARETISDVFDRLRYAAPGSSALDDLALDDLAERLNELAGGIDRYDEWAQIVLDAQFLDENGLSDQVVRLDDGRLAPESAADEFSYATAEARWNAARRALPDLNELAHCDRHNLAAQFRDLDKRRLEETQRLLRASHLQQLPKGAHGEMGFLLGEIAKKRRHLPIRKVIQRAGNMVQRIKPVFLMSPISIAQFLPPDTVTFDLLVIDEASQVRPEEALGAVARCRQIAVVGDQKQLPPTSFFDRIAKESEDDGDDEEIGTAGVTEMESILTACEAKGLNGGLLAWYYRSRDPSLIAVNNDEFYHRRLILPPSPVQDEGQYGLRLTRVSGVYSSRSRGGGRPGTNRVEAEEVVKRLSEHARIQANLSVGIIAFSKAQSDMVTEVLELARRQDYGLDAFLREDKMENVFVKNIENVQGDERDVILITVGYGPHEPGGRLISMNFGPVNSEGGERRLNVLFSRARFRCEVFCSFNPSDIDLSRTSRDRAGPRVLKRFLEFSESGQLHEAQPTGKEADSTFEEDVAHEIKKMAYDCDPQVGSAGFRIDLGVRHPDRPGRYILAVECDGARYHSALWARERDRLRQDVLEGMGWRFHRIWSTDWFHRRQHELGRLGRALEKANGGAGPSWIGSNADRPTRLVEESPRPENGQALGTSLSVPFYSRADTTFEGDSETPQGAPIEELAELVRRIVELEGPIHEEEIGRRVSATFGLSRTGRRIREAVRRALGQASRDDGLAVEGSFCMTKDQRRNPPVRDRSNENSTTAQAEYLPPVEIRAAAAMIEKESGHVPEDELVVATARLLGFSRTGKDVREQIQAALDVRSSIREW